jgi:hypothetical protein
MPQTKIHLPETVIAARRKYVEKEPIEQICADLNIGKGRLYKYLAGNVRGMTLPPIPMRRPGMRRRTIKSVRLAVVQRVWQVAEQQLAGTSRPAVSRQLSAAAICAISPG